VDPLAHELKEDLGKTPDGRPRVKLDRLDFPDNFEGSAYFKRHLKTALGRAVRRAEWGGGRENTIEYRFSVSELSAKLEGGVLQVSCAAVGHLPGGQSAKSQLSFGGSPKERSKVVKKVLEIVAQGVITRLAELERARRGLK
jgi:hypothetical protein